LVKFFIRTDSNLQLHKVNKHQVEKYIANQQNNKVYKNTIIKSITGSTTTSHTFDFHCHYLLELLEVTALT